MLSKKSKSMSLFSRNPLIYVSKSEFTMNTPFYNISRLFVAAALVTMPAATQAQSFQGVEAQLDVAHTIKNQTVVIDVTRNDYESPWSGTLHLDKVVLQNHGEASIENGKILFTPAPDFKGSALINYTVCNDLKQCDCGLAIVEVSDNPMPTFQEMKIFALEDATVTFTLPLGFTLIESSKRGSVNPTAQLGEWEYKPNTQMVGFDNCLFTFTDTDGTIKGYEVKFEVLKKPLQYVSNDIFSTAVNKSTRFNVLDNDYKHAIVNISYGTCEGGQIQGFDDGWVTFIPNSSYKGQASFTYTVSYSVGNTVLSETAKVLINVSNFLPAREQFSLTCAGIPLVIKYPAPISNFRFEPLSETTEIGASVKFYESIDTTISGHVIKGENILLYTPNLNSGRESDEFWVQYCNGNDCDNLVQVFINIIEPASSESLCATDCVWPGDANGDGIVNVLDIFPIGHNMGAYGTARRDKNSEWYGHGSENWGIDTYKSNGVDLKYTDTNGDGVISADDVKAIARHYSKTSTIVPTKSIQEGAIEVQLLSSVSSARPGDLIEMIVSMGNAENPAYDAKGLSFAIGYDAQLIQEESVKADFGFFNWLSRYDAYLPFDFPVERGKLEAGLVRSKGKGASGHGEVGKIKAIVISDNVAGFRAGDKPTLKFSLKDAYMMTPNGHAIKLKTKDLEIPLVIGKKSDPLKNDDLVMYPNPANDMVNFYINGVNKIDYVRIMDAAGREVSFLKNVDAKSASVQLDASMRGFYIAEIMTEKGRIIKKLEVFK